MQPRFWDRPYILAHLCNFVLLFYSQQQLHLIVSPFNNLGAFPPHFAAAFQRAGKRSFFDIQKAYDMIWREGLLIKIREMGVND